VGGKSFGKDCSLAGAFRTADIFAELAQSANSLEWISVVLRDINQSGWVRWEEKKTPAFYLGPGLGGTADPKASIQFIRRDPVGEARCSTLGRQRGRNLKALTTCSWVSPFVGSNMPSRPFRVSDLHHSDIITYAMKPPGRTVIAQREGRRDPTRLKKLTGAANQAEERLASRGQNHREGGSISGRGLRSAPPGVHDTSKPRDRALNRTLRTIVERVF